ncbi:MAG: Uma2 family endonuclease [Sarcina sp.]
MLNSMRDERKTYEEFLELQKNCEDRLEFINGIIMMSPSPSIAHQRISGNLYFELRKYLNGKKCDVFSAPTDILLVKNNEKNLVIPDLSVICDKTGFTNNQYIGIPSLMIEILSPSNQSYDLIVKLDMYMRYGVKEYWIVNPMKKSLTIFALDEAGGYEQYCVLHETGTIESKLFFDFKITMEDILNGI